MDDPGYAEETVARAKKYSVSGIKQGDPADNGSGLVF